jgi:hypothetical protein
MRRAEKRGKKLDPHIRLGTAVCLIVDRGSGFLLGNGISQGANRVVR